MQCYAYLGDVADLASLGSSLWFSRGWTLQELLAPRNVMFYDKYWHELGTRTELVDYIVRITGIKEMAVTSFQCNGPKCHYSVAQRMFWAAKRRTSRSEDMAYCLMGLFDVNMPLLYGEGARKAFHRLQENIMKNSRDETILAWGVGLSQDDPLNSSSCLARAPSQFAGCAEVYECSQYFRQMENPRTEALRSPYVLTHKGLQIETRLSRHSHSAAYSGGGVRKFLLYCGPKPWEDMRRFALYIVQYASDEPDVWHRVGVYETMPSENLEAEFCPKQTIFLDLH